MTATPTKGQNRPRAVRELAAVGHLVSGETVASKVHFRIDHLEDGRVHFRIEHLEDGS